MSNKKTATGQYAAYASKGSYSKNKEAKIKRHLKKYPEDKQALLSLKNIKAYSRKKPVNKLGWVTETIKASLQYIPLLTNKGQILNIRKPEQVQELMSKYGQTSTVTKETAGLMARIISFGKVVMFHKTLVVEDGKYVWKHVKTSKNTEKVTG